MMESGIGRIALMERKRRQMLWSNAVAFGLWQGLSILGDLTGGESGLRATFSGLSLLPWLVWTLSLIQIFRFTRQMAREPKLARVLSDELWAHNRLKAVGAAFVAVMIAQCSLILLSLYFKLDAAVAARITITVGVTTMIVAFLHFDNSGSSELGGDQSGGDA